MSEAHNPRDADRLIYAGLLGLAVAGIIQLPGDKPLSLAQFVEVYSFAVAIPLLATGFVTESARRAGESVPRRYYVIGFLGCTAAVVGLAALFFHYGIGPGITFTVCMAVGFVLVRRP